MSSLDSPENSNISGGIGGGSGFSRMDSARSSLKSGSMPSVVGGGRSVEYGPTVQQILETYEQLRNKAQSVAKRKLRSWENDFFLLSSFQKVSQPKEITDRLERNIRYFLLNYIVIVFGMTLLSLMLNPVSLIIIILATFSSAFVASRPTDVVVLPGDNSLSKRAALYTVAAITALVILTFSGTLLLTSLAVSIILVIIHASIHVGKPNYDQVTSLDSEV
ncbi:hypothetical protein FG386_002711 [Cryptosporidium ryanae]|uniref:uncharacterized protein n=1 Tax=Cryptosporidium ryanae TaxID=515981 RepID=UPI00351A5844|nr:hypothetical protein FG386_002711 [Cryptosporidium ryanae]